MSLNILDAVVPNDIVTSELNIVKSVINNKTDPFCYTGHSGTKQAFISGKWNSFLNEKLVIVYPFCLMTKELGNKLGNYFNELACAENIGAHFLAIHTQWDLIGSHQNVSDISVEKLAFLQELPTVIAHKSPNNMTTAIEQLKSTCHCTRYCWQDKSAPWVKSIPTIGSYIRRAVTAYYAKVKSTKTELLPDTDLTNAHSSVSLPIVPDVAIQYRCGDNIAFSYMYGILPFTAFPSRIPSNAKFIYVLSDHPSRAAHSPYSGRCQLVLSGLFDYLTSHFPNATVVVKRGGDVFLDYVRLTLANVTICSASTYCLWPALANTGTVHFPLSSLIAGADTAELAPNLAPNFHWITEPLLISSFKNVKPWYKMVDILAGK